MKRMIVMGILTALLVSLLGGCGNANPPEGKEERKTQRSGAEEGGAGNPFPQELKEIPSSYYSAAEEQGTLVELSYETYESMSYEQKSQKIMKRAIVYLPYNYDEEERYPTFYLMHGGWSNETTWLGTPDQPERFKNVIDHAIANQEMDPMIIVCPTYNNLSGSDSGDYGLAIKLTENYHNELVNDLMPAVEGTYSTYAEGTTAEDFRNSRDYRGFGGFSMGSVATWRTFEYCLDYFRYFMPSSGSLTTNGGYMDEIVKNSGRTWDEFFILAMTGTDDFAASAFERQIESMREYTESFRYSDSESEGNLTYRIKEGYSHDGKASTEYAYNGLRWLWHENTDAVGAEDDGVNAATVRSGHDGGDIDTMQSGDVGETFYTRDTKIEDVISDSAFADYGRLIFPVDAGYYGGETLGELRLTWYSQIDPDKTVEIANYMKGHAEAGDVIFYDIYTEEEKAADPEKKDTGLFFFKGNPGEKFAICNAGGGFAYVGAMHDSFPHALELSKKGYNAFALIYRPGAQTACEDLARAIRFVFEHAEELEVDTDCYSLWGGSAGGRMAAYLGSYGTAAFGEKELPRPGAVIMQYTGHGEYGENDTPTYACVGENDGIASWRTMERRLARMSDLGIDTEFHKYPGLGHGFGLGTNTAADGWIEDAVAFWERQMEAKRE